MSPTPKETVLIIGATGHIGVSATIASLRSGRNVLAFVRNQASAEKLFKHAGTREGITTVEVDVTSYESMREAVERVGREEGGGFQHVFAAVGGMYDPAPLLDLTDDVIRAHMLVDFEANVSYRATLPHLLSQANPKSTWTTCTGAQGDLSTHPAPAMSQGALFSFCTAAARETAGTNVRFNEIYLFYRVEVDEEAEKHGVMRASEFAGVYEGILGDEGIRGARVRVEGRGDLRELRVEDGLKLSHEMEEKMKGMGLAGNAVVSKE